MIKIIVRLLFSLVVVACLVLLLYVGSFTYNNHRQDRVALSYNNFQGYSLSQDQPVWDLRRMLPFWGTKIVYVDNPFFPYSFDIKGQLPNVNLFLAHTLEADSSFFNYNLQGDLAFRLNPTLLPKALNDGVLDLKGLKNYYTTQATLIEAEISSFLEQPSILTDDTASARDSLTLAIQKHLEQKFPLLEWQNISLTQVVFPNVQLYNQVLEANLAKVKAVSEAQSAVAYQVAQQAATQSSRLQLLEDYGKLLTQYPILVQFFAVDSGKTLPREALADFMPPASQNNPITESNK